MCSTCVYICENVVNFLHILFCWEMMYVIRANHTFVSVYIVLCVSLCMFTVHWIFKCKHLHWSPNQWTWHIYLFIFCLSLLSTQPQIASATAECHEWDLHMYLFGKDARINRPYMHGTYLVCANLTEHTNVTATPKHAEWWCNLSLQWRFVSDRQCYCYALRCVFVAVVAAQHVSHTVACMHHIHLAIDVNLEFVHARCIVLFIIETMNRCKRNIEFYFCFSVKIMCNALNLFINLEECWLVFVFLFIKSTKGNVKIKCDSELNKSITFDSVFVILFKIFE